MPHNVKEPQAAMSAPEWELSKENVAPLASGRNVDTLNAALKKSPQQLEQERIQHFAAVTDAAKGIGPFAADPLAPWVTYVKWAAGNFPRGSNVLVAAVEGACRSFTKDSRYLDDRRFVRLWVRYADMRKDKLDVFEYMHRRHIGEHVGLFYEAWATTYELERQFQKADDTYALGKSMNAEPAARLSQRQREFFARMAARKRRAEKKAKEAAEKKAVAEKVKETAKSVRERNHLADDILSRCDKEDVEDLATMAVDSENVAPGSGRVEMVRPALGRITERQALTGRRPVTAVERKPSGRLMERPVDPPQLQNSGKRKAGKVDVFVDSEVDAVSQATGHQKLVRQEDEHALPLLAKRDEVTKENDGPLPSKWAGQTLPQDQRIMNRLRRGGLAPSSAIEIYQDVGSEDSDRGPTDDVNMSKDDQQPLSEAKVQSPASVRKRSGQSMAVSPTINTKIAMAELEEVFSDPLPVEVVRDEETMSAKKQSFALENNQEPPARFEIFKDASDNDKENAFGVVCHPHTASGPSGNPDLEKRVLQPISELEGPYVERLASEAGDENVAPLLDEQKERVDEVLRDEQNDELLDFLAEWCSKEPTYFLLDGPDPQVDRDGLVELQPKQNTIEGQLEPSSFRPHDVVSFDVDEDLWNGCEGNSKVFAVEDIEDVYCLFDSNLALSNNEQDQYIALKVSETTNAWEYYIYKTIHDRYGAVIKSIATAVAFYEGSPRSYLLLDVVYNCSLAETISLSPGKHISEALAMFFTTDLLRTLEALHTVGIIHSDVTLENILFRCNTGEELVEERYVASGSGSWSNKGILLVDFNHAIDAKQAVPKGKDAEALAAHAAKLGNRFLCQDYRIPGATSWSFNADCYAAAVCSAKMLGLSSLKDMDSPQKLAHTRVWETYFAAVQAMSATTRSAETVDTMRRCREEMEGILVEDNSLRKAVERLGAETLSKRREYKTMGR